MLGLHQIKGVDRPGIDNDVVEILSKKGHFLTFLSKFNFYQDIWHLMRLNDYN